jgi:hypothetical protein
MSAGEMEGTFNRPHERSILANLTPELRKRLSINQKKYNQDRSTLERWANGGFCSWGAEDLHD